MDASVKTLYIFRHPEIVASAEPSCLGQTDVEMKSDLPTAWEKITTTAKIFQPERIVSSDLKRCKIPATHAAGLLNLPVDIQPAWREIHFGEWDGLSWSVIEKRWPEAMVEWMKEFVNVAPPGGESMQLFHSRIGTALEHLLSLPEKKILVVTHSGVMRSIFCRVAGAPLQKAFAVEFGFCGLLKVEQTPVGLRILF